MKAFAYSSGFFPRNDIDAAVNLIGSRMPMWQDSQRSTILASGTLICWICGVQASVLFCRPLICAAVRSTMCSET